LRAPDPNRVRESLPLFDALFTDAQDRLWVKRPVDSTVRFVQGTIFGVPSVSAKATPRFEVYSPQGTLIAFVSAPSYIGTLNPPRFAITGERVFTMVWDDDGVPYLCAFRITARPAPPTGGGPGLRQSPV
jgi:hypothetical protein